MYGYLDELNQEQREAVLHRDGPLLLLAGAGSGKTRVITCRVAHIIHTGTLPDSVLAMTFTNKAASEMAERVGRLVGGEIGRRVTICTFHKLGVRILREDGGKMGFSREFTILDEDDQAGAVRDAMRECKVDPERYEPSWLLNRISQAKNAGITTEMLAAGSTNAMGRVVSKVYKGYMDLLRSYSAVDFDDLLLVPLALFREHPDVLEKYRQRYKHILVDEFQDTNGVQLELVRLLAHEHRNLCVVGDDDQSIYSWRGARLENILEFEDNFPDAHVVALTQNYRSTSHILNAANAVIQNNRSRREKSLWTRGEDGEPLRYVLLKDPSEESAFISEEIERLQMEEGRPLSDFGILFRANIQARSLEEALRRAGLRYRLVGGMTFYDRKEVKDVLAYLKWLVNPSDEMAIRRSLAFPSRGVGPASIKRLYGFAEAQGISLLDAMGRAEEVAGLNRRVVRSCMAFAGLRVFRERLMTPGADLGDVVTEILKEVRFLDGLAVVFPKADEARSRWAHVEILVESMDEFVRRSGPETDLGDYLRVLSLDHKDDDVLDQDEIMLMTLHSAKGLEFPVVFLVGMEENIIPHWRSIEEGDVDEERRLFYVGVTRARQRLTMTGCVQRKRFGELNETTHSRFLDELPEDSFLRIDRTEGGDEDEEHGRAREVAMEKLAGLFDFSGNSGE